MSTEPLYCVHERWYLPPTSSGLAIKLSSYRGMPYPLALAMIQRWRAAQNSGGDGCSDYWMVPA